jgi:serine/threonine protein kinase
MQLDSRIANCALTTVGSFPSTDLEIGRPSLVPPVPTPPILTALRAIDSPTGDLRISCAFLQRIRRDILKVVQLGARKTMAVGLEEFVKQLADSGVIAPGKLEGFVPPKAQPKDAQELARQLVQSKQLTKFQVQEIYQGRAKTLILGNYTILDKIGAGGMGQVFKAEHRRMKRVVAIKTLPKAFLKDAAAVARFQREVEAAAKLSHPNIVAAFDADEAGGVNFLVMEYVAGSDLSALVKKCGPLNVGKAVNYILQAARGLDYAHKHGVIHRDIKPANLLLDSEGTVKILDMGLARFDSASNVATQAELTGSGAVMGTVDYMAPEQALSAKHADARADVYSLGCSLYYLLTGRTAYDGDSLMAKLLAHREQPTPTLGAEVPEEVQAVFQKMVAKKFEDRFQTMGEVVAALEQCSFSQQTSFDINAATTMVQSAAPARTTHESGRIEKARLKAGTSRKTYILGAVGAGCLAVAIFAAIFIKLHTKDGTPSIKATLEPAEKVTAGPNERWNTPAFQQWIKDVAALPAEKQVDAVAKKLQELNPGFDGKELHSIDGGAVTELRFASDNVADISPVRALAHLRVLACSGSWDKRKLEDLSPLRGLKLTFLNCSFSLVSDLSPLAGMPLVELWCNQTPVSNLTPLKGTPLTRLHLQETPVSDLSPLKGMPLTVLQCNETQVSDLSPLEGMRLLRVWLTPRNITQGINVIRQMKSVRMIGVRALNPLPADEFWKKYDAGEFGKANRRVAKSPQ